MNVEAGTNNSPAPEPTPTPSPTPAPAPEPTPAPAPAPAPTPAPEPAKSLIGGEEPKPEPSPEPVEFVPLTAEDITFPDGVEVNEALRDEALAVINNRELSPKDQLQGLIDLQVKAAQAASEASSQAWAETQTTWQNEVKVDPEVGGEKLQPALGRIGRLISEYGSDEVTQVLDLTGAGNNVHMIKMFDKIASKLVEGGPISGAPVNSEVDRASRLYPTMNK